MEEQMEDSDKVSKDFRYGEFKVSASYPELATKIKLSEKDRLKIFYAVKTILQPTRDRFNNTLEITSSKRSKPLNKKVGGVDTSDHLYLGESFAGDFFVHNVNMLKVFEFIKSEMPYAFGQLIFYIDSNGKPEFIHVSLPTQKHKFEAWYKYKGQRHEDCPVDLS